MTKGLFALLMAGSLMVPLITPALGSESTVGLGGARQPVRPRASWDGLPLPPAASRHDAMAQFRVRDKGPEDGHPVGSPT
jgi:hypothetical protein